VDLRVIKVILDCKVLEVHRVYRAILVTQAAKDKLDIVEATEYRALLAQLVLKAHKDLAVVVAHRVSLAQ
jgi:hypothetical protein